MLQQLTSLNAARPSEREFVRQGNVFKASKSYSCVSECVDWTHDPSFLTDEAEDPACIPIFWISKWVDYSDKYGLGKPHTHPRFLRSFLDFYKYIVKIQISR